MVDLLVGRHARYNEAEMASCRRPWVIDEGRINAVVNEDAVKPAVITHIAEADGENGGRGLRKIETEASEFILQIPGSPLQIRDSLPIRA